MPEWEETGPPLIRDWGTILAGVKDEQPANPEGWAKAAVFASANSGRVTANRLRKQYGEQGFEFYTSIDTATKEVTIYARYTGG